MIQKRSLYHSDFFYYQKGSNPKLLLQSGTHGDEFDVIDLVTHYIQTNQHTLPDFMYVPQVSPSAVKRKTRYNKNKSDINRIFFDSSHDEEVQKNIELLKNHTFDLCVSFHEDPVETNFYLYDCGYTHDKPLEINGFFKKLTDKGVSLLNGYDDVADPALGYLFKNGYKFFTNSSEKDEGMISAWLLGRKISKWCMIPEIPGLLPKNKKQLIVTIFFEEVIQKFIG